MRGEAVCFGAGHWDWIGRPSAPLEPGGDAPGVVERRPGGVALNLALALAGRGRAARLCAPVGTDAAGAALAGALAAAGVALTRVGDGPTGVYLAVEDGRGGLAAAVADLAACAGVTAAAAGAAAAAAPEAAAWALDGNFGAAALAALAEAAERRGARLALVPASAAKAGRLAGLLARADLVICNRAEAAALVGRDLPDARAAASALRAAGATEAAVTDGPREAAAATAEGVWGLTPEADGGPSGATGAGDALAAAYLDLRLEGAPPEGALSAGIAAARAARTAA